MCGGEFAKLRVLHADVNAASGKIDQNEGDHLHPPTMNEYKRRLSPQHAQLGCSCKVEGQGWSACAYIFHSSQQIDAHVILLLSLQRLCEF
jgi:hypothetical protein